MPHCQLTIFQIDGGNDIEISAGARSVGVMYPGERIDSMMECPAGAETADLHLSITLDAE